MANYPFGPFPSSLPADQAAPTVTTADVLARIAAAGGGNGLLPNALSPVPPTVVKGMTQRAEQPAGLYTPAGVIKSRQRMGESFGSAPIAPMFGAGTGGTIVGGLTNAANGFMSTYLPAQAEEKERANVAMQQAAYKAALQAGDNSAAARALAGGTPDQQGQGLAMTVAERQRAADREAAALQREYERTAAEAQDRRKFEYEKRMQLDLERERMNSIMSMGAPEATAAAPGAAGSASPGGPAAPAGAPAIAAPAAPPPQQQSQLPPGVVPQSLPGEAPGGQGGIVLAQTAPQPAPGAPPPAPAAKAAPAEPTIYFNGRQVPLSKARGIADTLLMTKGYEKLGEALNARVTETDAKLGKEGNNEIDKKLINASEQAARLDRMTSGLNIDNLLSFEGRVKGGWLGVVDMFENGSKNMSPEDAKFLTDYTTLRSRAADNLNSYIKEITGAAMTQQEAERLMMVQPNAGDSAKPWAGDSPRQFKAKLEERVQGTKYALARYEYAKQTGKVWKDIPLDAMPQIMNQRGNDLLKQMQAQSPNANLEQLKPFVRQQMKQEFGI